MKKKFPRIRELRKSLSLREMEKLVGVPATTIDRAERGDSDPKSELIIAYCTSFNVSADWLLGLSDQPGSGGKLQPESTSARQVVSQIRANAEKAMRKAEELIQIMDEIDRTL